MLPHVEMKIWVLRLFSGSWTALFVLASALVDGLPPASVTGWLLLGTALLLASGLFVPRLMLVPYRLVDKLLMPVGRMFAFAMLAVVYFGVFTPFAVVLHLVGWDPLRRRCKRWPASGWVARSEQISPTDYRWQY